MTDVRSTNARAHGLFSRIGRSIFRRPWPSGNGAPAADWRKPLLDKLPYLTSESPISEEQRNCSIGNFQALFPFLLEVVPTPLHENMTVLEAGVGLFGWAGLYRKFFNRVYAVDIEDYSRYHPGVEFIQADLAKGIPLPEASVDLIVCHSVLEHVLDVPGALASFDRILKPGGYLYLTVDPLYYSAEGSHVNEPAKLAQWEHLDPGSPYYLLDNPLPDAETGGHTLNKMTYAHFVGWTGLFPWSILRAQLAIDPRPLPDYVKGGKFSEMELRTRGFLVIARKEWHCTESGTRAC